MKNLLKLPLRALISLLCFADMGFLLYNTLQLFQGLRGMLFKDDVMMSALFGTVDIKKPIIFIIIGGIILRLLIKASIKLRK